MGMFLGGMGVGLGLMYLLDPDRGGKRRAMLRDRGAWIAHRSGRLVARTGRDLGQRARQKLMGAVHRSQRHGSDHVSAVSSAFGSSASMLDSQEAPMPWRPEGRSSTDWTPAFHLLSTVVGFVAVAVAARLAKRIETQLGPDALRTAEYAMTP